MMDIRQFENRLKSEAGNHTEDVNTEALWNVVSKSLNGKKKKRKAFWLFLGLLTIAASSIFIYQNQYYRQLTDIDKSIVDLDQIVGQVGFESNIAYQELKTDASLSLIRETNKNLNVNEQAVKKFAKQDGQVRPIQGEYINQYEPPSKTRESTTKPINGTSIINRSDAKTNLSEIAKIENNQLEESFGSVDHSGQIDLNVNVNSNEVFAPLPTGIIPHNVMHAALSIDKLFYSKLDINNRNLPQLPQRANLFNKERKWSIALMGGLDFNQVALDQLGLTIDSELYATRRASLSTLPSWNTSVQLGYAISSNLRVTTGIDLRSIISESTKLLLNTEQVLEDGILIERVIGPDGVEDVFGPGLVTKETSSLRTRISSNLSMSIPVGVDYSFGGGQWRPYIGAGFDYSFLLYRTGLVHLHSNEEYDIGEDANDLLSNQLGLSLSLSTGFDYSLSQFMSIRSRLGWRKELFTHFNSSSGFSEKYTSIRIQLGVGYKF